MKVTEKILKMYYIDKMKQKILLINYKYLNIKFQELLQKMKDIRQKKKEEKH